MFKDVGGVWGVGSCLHTKRVRIVLPACLAGLFTCIVVCVLLFFCFVLFKAQISEGYTYRNVFCDYLYYVGLYTDCLYSI